nr:glycoside hydrolase family 55 protein [Robertmurraya korlensis]
MIRRWSRYQTNVNQLIEETEALFQKVAVQPKGSIHEMRTIVSEDGEAIPFWFPTLDAEFNTLLSNIKYERNVVDFGAVGDGVTDNTHAFQKAIGRGGCKVIIPEGVFVTKRIKLPSNTLLMGAGKGKTTLKLHQDAPKSAILVTNKNHISGNHHIYVEGMTLDWNVERLPHHEKTASGNNRSSCLTFANVTYGWVKKVEAIQAGLHAFDVSSTLYYYMKDGFIGPGRSKYIWLDELNGYGFGDDGITTHHSDFIFISKSHMCDPSGRAHKQGFSNSNGIEIDDGSRYIWLANNTTTRCFGGVEIKAHHNASAASNVTIIGHLSVQDNRAFNFRHIGHHKGEDPESKTAYNIRAMNLVAIAPIFTPLYEGSTPRAMVISAYRNVVVNQFTILGDPTYDFGGHPIIAIQYRAKHVILNKIYIDGFYHAGGIKGQYYVPEELI